MPVPSNAPIEGYPNPGSGDRHVLVLDNSNCWLYELYSSYPNNDGSWNAASAAVWDLLNYNQRPYTWTSADAAGLSIFAGLVRYDEVAAGEIKHAIRVTFAQSQAAFVLPATHWAANSSNANAPPMGMRLRLKSSFNISSFLAGQSGNSHRAEKIRHDQRRQRQLDVHQRRARRSLEQRRFASTQRRLPRPISKW